MNKLEYALYLIFSALTTLFGFVTMIRCLFTDYPTITAKVFYSVMMCLIGLLGIRFMKITSKEYKQKKG